MRTRHTSFLKSLGPGILFAGVSVGASHLVQSTRAGAAYGLALIVIIILSNLAKYPAFRFGAQYSSVTGVSLLHGYHKFSKWAIPLYILIALGTMFAAIPAVTLVTAGLAQAVFGLDISALVIGAVLLIVCNVVLIVGGYRVLDRVMKVVMVVLTISTIVATALVLPKIDWAASGGLFPSNVSPVDFLFIAALLGLMPTSVDISIWHSLWSVAKSRDSEQATTPREAVLDFHVGFFGSMFLALCFVLLGAGVMHGTGVQFESSAGAFAMQLIELYTATLGEWSAVVIGAAAFMVMLSTVLAGLDGYPRAAVTLMRIYWEQKGQSDDDGQRSKHLYAFSLIVISAGSFGILAFYALSLKVLIDIAATIAFLFAPLIAWLNHRAMTLPDLPTSARPGTVLRIWSLIGVIVLTAMALTYLYLRFVA